MVVIDVGAHYLGYSSDICRSFFIDPPAGAYALGDRFLDSIRRLLGFPSGRSEEETTGSDLHAEKLRVWKIVLEAQTAAADAFRPNATAASVDIAARTVIEKAGYGYGFTHRLGHGIGIKGQQRPLSGFLPLFIIARPNLEANFIPKQQLTSRRT